MASLDDYPEFHELLGIRERVPCTSCSRESPFRKLNLLESDEQYFFLSDECVEKDILTPMAKIFAKRLKEDEKLSGHFADVLSKAALWEEDPEMRQEAAERLQQLIEHIREPDEEEH
jgi:hypothetical protein